MTNASRIGGANAGGTAQGNTSLHDGGGIWSQNVSIIDSVVDANSTTNGYGGGFKVSLDAHLTTHTWTATLLPMETAAASPTTAATSSLLPLRPAPPQSRRPAALPYPKIRRSTAEASGIKAASLIIDSQTLIDNNSALGDGGGIWVGGVGRSLRIDTSTVSHNQAVHGGGIAADGADSVTLFQTRVLFNTATAPGTDPGGPASSP